MILLYSDWAQSEKQVFMANKWFEFRQFRVDQDKTAMKVGTDGVLLGAWSSLPQKGHRCLDAGAGTGLLSLMICQRCPETFVDAIEIDKHSALQCEENFQNSPWTGQLAVHHVSLQDFRPNPPLRYGLLICNPPYFTASRKSDDASRNMARHDEFLDMDDLFAKGKQLLGENGILSFIVPFDKKSECLKRAADFNFYLFREANVISSPGKAPKRWMAEFSRHEKEILSEDILIEESGRHQYSNRYKELTAPFYLNVEI